MIALIHQSEVFGIFGASGSFSSPSFLIVFIHARASATYSTASLQIPTLAKVSFLPGFGL
jgi:hypothetical protein